MFKVKMHIDFDPESYKHIMEMYRDGTLLRNAKGFQISSVETLHDDELNLPYCRVCGFGTPLLAFKVIMARLFNTGFRVGW